jgi:hypothetical protein
MTASNSNHRTCALLIIADGFEEIETGVFVILLRQAGVCVKVVGLTSGLIGGAHGLWLKPDLTLGDLDGLAREVSIDAVILPDGSQSLARLEADPRVHKLLREVVARGGHIVTGREGLRVPRAASLWRNGLQAGVAGGLGERVLLRESAQPLGGFVHDLARRLKRSA